MQTITLQNLLNRLHFESSYYTADLIESNKNNKITIKTIRNLNNYLKYNMKDYITMLATSIVDYTNVDVLNERYNEIHREYVSIEDLEYDKSIKKITDKESENDAKYLAVYLSEITLAKEELEEFVTLLHETIEAHSDNELLKRFF